MQDFKNTRWLITGGTSGLGLALVNELAKQGARVAVVARGVTNPGVRLENGVIQITGDVGAKEDIYKISGQALGRLGGLDYLVNNASALGPTPLKLLPDSDCEDFEKVLGVNLLGPFRLTKALLAPMLLQKKGTVINISSDAAVNAYSAWGFYGTSKAALDHLSHIWAEELSAYNVKFLSVDPGDMDTPLHEAAIPGADRGKLKRPALAAVQLLEELKRETPAAWRRVSL